MKFLNNPNIVKIKEVYEGSKHIYIVMENFKGKNLL